VDSETGALIHGGFEWSELPVARLSQSGAGAGAARARGPYFGAARQRGVPFG
jgi:hypothetical protein